MSNEGRAPIDRAAVAASDRAKGARRDRRWSASTGLVTALLLVSLVLATPAMAGRLNKIGGTASADRIRWNLRV
jgi:hypothetical protein